MAGSAAAGRGERPRPSSWPTTIADERESGEPDQRAVRSERSPISAQVTELLEEIRPAALASFAGIGRRRHPTWNDCPVSTEQEDQWSG